MSADGVILVALIGAIWIGWPLYKISDHLGALRKIAERNQR
ncbi:hypothetical protein [Sphingobium yanoikuyae]|nr:hypothetical protein [Sphingobium yanoikuyae]